MMENNSNLPSYNSATSQLSSESSESISVRNNNVINKANHQQQQQPQQQQQQQQIAQYHDPPYLIRHSRAFRHFKNPPQPHMCIKTYLTDDGQELFINVMSWTKICMPQNPATDPIPLYGGMRVTSGSPKSPALVFAVMANPAILKHVGRKCSDMEEKYALVKLMCDFVEAMNPGLKLARDAEVLKDRDLSGELKDIWGAVQAKRLREKDAAPSYESYLASQNQIYIDFGPQDAPPYQSNTIIEHHQQEQLQRTKLNADRECNQLNSVLNVDEVDNNVTSQQTTVGQQQQQVIEQQQQAFDRIDNNSQSTSNSSHRTSIQNSNVYNSTTAPANANGATPPPPPPSAQIENNDSNKNDRTVTKKDKLSGFLPNGCHNIFPFIKAKSSSQDKNNSAHKEKHDTTIQNANQKDSSHHHQQQQQQQSSCGSRKMLYGNNKDHNKSMQNCDTANLESATIAISKLDIGKAQ